MAPNAVKWRGWLVFGVILAGYVSLITFVGKFPFIDDIAFKAAGREWAQTGRFAAPELWDFRQLQPPVQEVWFAHLPIYTFLFGLVVSMVGFGAKSAIAFDLSIHALLAAITCATARTLSPSISFRTAAIAGVAVLPLGVLGRPDDLAIAIALLGLRHMHAAQLTVPRSIVAGCLFGLSAATSGGVAFQLGLVGLPSLLLAVEDGGVLGRLRKAMVLSVAWIGAGAIVFAVATLPILVGHPNAVHQYLQHAATQVGQVAAESYEFSWRYGKQFIFPALGVLICAAITFNVSRRWMLLWLGPVLATLNLLVFFPAKYPYLWFVVPWAIASLAAEFEGVRRTPVRWAGLFILPLLWLGGAMPTFQSLLVHLKLPREQRFEESAERIRKVIPLGARVIASEHWSALAWDHAVFDPLFSDVDVSTIDYIVLTGNGSGTPGRPVEVRRDRKLYVDAHFVQVDSFINREPNRFLGLQLGRSSYGYGAIVLKRTK